ncbi:MAG TPA: glycosyltransferase [Anaerolineae bacterium]|nr:glycosyltransferase [Anaerolineae bacterium]
MSPRLLFLTPDLPYPPHQGAAIRTFNLIRNLSSRHEIHLLSFVHGGDSAQRIAAMAVHCARVLTVPAPHRSTLRRAMSVLLSSSPDMALRLPSDRFSHQLRSCLSRERFDFVQIEAIEMAQYGLAIKEMAQRDLPIVVFDDINAEYLLQKRAFENDLRQARRWLGALYSFIQWRKLQRYEASVCRQLDRIVVVSEADAGALQRLLPDLQCAVVPNGVDTQFFHPWDKGESETTLVFTGKMDFRPNIDAMLWFVQEVLPLVREQVPQVLLKVVGRNPHPRLDVLHETPNVELTGYVDDVRPYIGEAAVYVVPLRVGGGTRLKILEAMSMAKAIVSTSLGREGIQAGHDRELLVADDPASFAEAVVSLLRDSEHRSRLGLAARNLAESQHDWTRIAPLLERVYEG